MQKALFASTFVFAALTMGQACQAQALKTTAPLVRNSITPVAPRGGGGAAAAVGGNENNSPSHETFSAPGDVGGQIIDRIYAGKANSQVNAGENSTPGSGGLSQAGNTDGGAQHDQGNSFAHQNENGGGTGTESGHTGFFGTGANENGKETGYGSDTGSSGSQGSSSGAAQDQASENGGNTDAESQAYKEDAKNSGDDTAGGDENGGNGDENGGKPNPDDSGGMPNPDDPFDNRAQPHPDQVMKGQNKLSEHGYIDPSHITAVGKNLNR